MATCNPATLPGLATCFSCIPDGFKATANLYLLNTIVGGTTDPNTLESLASRFAQFFGGWHDSVKAYLLAVINGGTRDPAALANAANQFIGYVRDPDGRSNVETYLWAQIANITNTQTIITNAGPYQRVRGDEWKIELYLLAQKAGITNPQTISQNAACFLSCLSPGTTRDVIIYLLCQILNGNMLSSVPTPTGFNFLPTDLSGNGVVASWNAPPSGVTATEVWTSTDNVNFSLATTVASPATSISILYGGAGVKNWCKIRWLSGALQSQFTSSILIPGEVPVWIKAVVTNGGAQVSQATALAMNTFAIALVNAAIDTMMQAMCCFVPDNLTAAITPLYKTQGNDPWVNVSFVGGDLTVNGLTGDAATKVLDTGVVSTTAWQNTGGNINASTSGGITVYTFTLGTVASGTDLGSSNNAPTGEIQLCSVFTPTSNNNTIWDFANNGTDRIAVLNTGWKGFTSGNRTGGSASAIYTASSGTPFNTLGSSAFNTAGHAMPIQSFCCHGFKSSVGTRTPNVDRTISFAALHIGLSSAQAQSLFNAVQALRVALGGGFI